MNWWGLLLAIVPHRVRLALSPTYRAGWWYVQRHPRRYAYRIQR